MMPTEACRGNKSEDLWGRASGVWRAYRCGWGDAVFLRMPRGATAVRACEICRRMVASAANTVGSPAGNSVPYGPSTLDRCWGTSLGNAPVPRDNGRQNYNRQASVSGREADRELG